MSIKRIIPAVLAATALLAVAAPAALAAKHPKHCVFNGNGARACFQPWGDRFWVKDTEANGVSATAVWKTSYGREGRCMNSSGDDTWLICNYNLRESGTIRFWSVDVDKPTNTYVFWSRGRRSNI